MRSPWASVQRESTAPSPGRWRPQWSPYPDSIVPIELTDRTAIIRFVRRDTEALDAERVTTLLGPTLVTTPEQTVLDLAKRPILGDARIEAEQATPVLYRRSDPTRLIGLAEEQGFMAALRRVIETVRTGGITP